MEKKLYTEKRNVMRITLIVGSAVALLKFAGWIVTFSDAILSDALESLVNILAGIVAIYSLAYAEKPRDTDHPYGHGKVEFLSAAFEGGLVLFAGLAIIIKAIYGFIHPAPISSLPFGLMVIAIGGLANLALGLRLILKGKKLKSLILEADGKHLLSDAYSSAGIFIGLGIEYFTKTYWLDDVIASAVGLLILWIGFKLVRKAISGLMDEADMKKLHEIVDILEKNRREPWIDIHNMRVIEYGSYLHIDCHVTLPWYWTLQQTHEQISDIEKIVGEHYKENVEFFIHSDPCLPSSCPVCMMKDCTVRMHPFRAKVKWELNNILANRKHGIEEA